MSRTLGHWVKESGKVQLAKLSVDPERGWDKAKAVEETLKLGDEMERLFDRLFFAGKNSLLLIFQGMDAAGKDGSIRHLFRHTHAQSCRVANFKVPTAEELGHDFLWRCHKQTPGKGEIVVFNRSHYEDVGVVRVHGYAPEEVWKGRYDHINAFERLLTDSGTIVLKFFLHISKEEQKERLMEREADKDAYWKLSAGDWKEREFWDEYQEAYGDAIGKCATELAPWVVVPAEKKWFRNLVVTQAVVDTLTPYAKTWDEELELIGTRAKEELEVYRSGL